MSNGSVIGAPVVPTFAAALGIWRPSQVARQLQSLNLGLSWPVLADPSFASVTFLCHFDDAGPLVNKGSVAVAPVLKSDATISTAQNKFSRSSAFVPSTTSTSAEVRVTSNAGWQLGTGDFTIEAWMRFPSIVAANIWDFRTSGSSVTPNFWTAANGNCNYFVSGSTVIASAAGVLTTNTWYHIAIARVSGTTKMFVDGTQVGSNYTDSNNYTSNGFSLGNGNLQAGIGTSGGDSYFAEVRITKGVARYTANFTVPALRFADY